MLPIVVVVGLVIYVLNLSRVFLSGHGHIPTVVGSTVMVVILIGATVLSNSSRLRSSSIALMTAIFALVIFTSGWLVLGHSQEQGEALVPLAANGPSIDTIDFQALASLKFAPASLTVPTGIYSVELTERRRRGAHPRLRRRGNALRRVGRRQRRREGELPDLLR